MAQKNTLFNYFTKPPGFTTPKNKKPEESPKSTSTSKSATKTNGELKKTPTTPKENGDAEEEFPKTPKSSVKGKKLNGQTPKNNSARKRIKVEPLDDSDLDESPSKKSKEDEEDVFDGEDSGDEFVPDETISSESEVSEDPVSEEEPESDDIESSPEKGKKRKRSTDTKKPNKKPLLALSTPSAKEKLKAFASPSVQAAESTASSENDGNNWSFMKCEFLKPERIRDAKKRRPSDPDYDSRTLHVPEEFLRDQTPAHRQWWEMKAKHFDCILFFKVGKFYELYHMDAVTGVKELSLTFMRGEYAHCGFPEIAYGRFSGILVDKGYKVARVEQTETPDMANDRCKKLHRATKFDKVVKREICQVTSKGTRVFSVIDGEAKEAESHYLLAIAEKELDNVCSTYGVCFVDSSIGTFHVGQFDDDRQSSRLRTLIALYPPVQVLFERGMLTKRTRQVLNTAVATALKEPLTPETEFWNATDTLMKLAERKYFEESGMPEELQKFIDSGDSFTAKKESELGVRALGAVVWCLTRSLLDFQLLSMSKFEVYVPVDMLVAPKQDEKAEILTKNMVMDAVTLKNLSIIEDINGNLKGTLLQRLDHCSTSFGKRLLRQWLCSPLTNVKSIIARQKAVSVLKDNFQVLKEVKTLLAKVPDLERLLSHIYAQSTKGIEETHPENRAIMFEERTYSKRKIIEFISVLNGFQSLQKVAVLLQDSGICEDSDILKRCSHFPSSSPPGEFPDLTESLKFFQNAFDHEEAEKEGRIIPSAGVDSEYDSVMETLQENERDLKSYLKKQCEHFGCKVIYVGIQKKRYQLEVPELQSRKANSDYQLVGQRKGFKRYSTAETKDFLEKQLAAEEVKVNVLQNLRKRIFSKFSDRFNEWYSALECISVLDVMLSLAEYAASVEGDICTPSVLSTTPTSKAYIKIDNGKYPCVTGEDNFIPNDSYVGGDSNIILLTGPNMGGKSTLMRQVGLLTIMAQMGSLVPAVSMEFTPVDRIFTRIGANDDIMSGESTFYLELCETSAILNHATKHSLVLVDELGRGTSTYDGTAIAASVLTELCQMDSRTIFSTHYHSLVERFKDNSHIQLSHMACMAESDDEDPEKGEETVTFLYKLAPGACPKSYGFNAARLAGIPSSITRLGHERAKQFEAEALTRKIFRLIFTSEDPKSAFSLL